MSAKVASLSVARRRRSKPGVLSVGRLYADLVFGGVDGPPDTGEEIFSDGLGLHPGGGCFTTAAWLVALGRGAWLNAVLPADPFTDALTGALTGSGVDLSLCTLADADAAPQLTVVIPVGGDRSFLTHQSGVACVPPDNEDLRPLPLGHMHIGELSTFVAHPDLAARARAAGMSVSLDCGWDTRVAPDNLNSLLAQVDVFLPNANEVAWLEEIGADPMLPGLTVVKEGSAGARAWQNGAVKGFAAVTPAKVIDATGAGDAFNAGFLNAWLDGVALEDCLKKGNHCGRSAVQAEGGTGALPMLSRSLG